MNHPKTSLYICQSLEEIKTIPVLDDMTYEDLRDKITSGNLPINTIVPLQDHLYSILKYILSKNSSKKQKLKDTYGTYTQMSILSLSIIANDRKFFRFLLENKIHLSLPVDTVPVLHTAIHVGRCEYAKKLIEAGVDVNQVNINNHTPLEVALANGKGDYKFIQSLLNLGAVIHYDKKDCFKFPVVQAALQGNLNLLKVLLNHCYAANLSISAQDDQEDTINFVDEVENNYRTDIQLFESYKLLFMYSDVDINTLDNQNRTFLHHIGKIKMPRTVEWLLDAGIDVNHRDNDNFLVLNNEDSSGYNTRVIKRHIVKLFCANFDVCQENLQAVCTSEFDQLRCQCSQEVELLKVTHICETNYTYYDLFYKSEHKLVKRLRSIETCVVPDEEILKIQFPCYAGMILYRLEKLEQRRNLIGSAEEILYKIFKTLPTIFVYELFYFLSNSDLMRLMM